VVLVRRHERIEGAHPDIAILALHQELVARAGELDQLPLFVLDLAESEIGVVERTERIGGGTGDLGRLRQVMTPEMLGYFSEELTRNTSEGVQNIVSDVRLLKGDITESWEEGDLQYATAHMQWSAVDYVARLGRSPGMPDYIVSGDPKQPAESEEVWTFVRQRNGNWLLSAIQQV